MMDGSYILGGELAIGCAEVETERGTRETHAVL